MKVPKSIQFPVRIENNRFSSNLKSIASILEHYNNQVIDVVFKKRETKRSNQQNGYYWGVIIAIFRNCIREEWGELWDKEKAHEFLLVNCNYEEKINLQTGQIVRVIKGSSENSTVEQEDYHTKCRLLVKDFFNVEIPMPNEQVVLEY